ncbi:MAG: TadE/TadG family type IV pilus assembly protein [Erythrobacter sp.]
MMKFPKIARLAKKLRSDASGISMVEFALVLPVILTLGLYGAEVARMANTKMKVSQIALSLADNASRLGQTDNSGVTPTITENDVEAILNGALRQGQSIGLEGNAKVILSSLEYEDPEDKQFISWQRCVGDVTWDSRYGNDSDKNGLNGDVLPGMGEGSTKITAESGSAVMFVEIRYEFEGIWQNPFGGGDAVFIEEAAFLIRDDRNLDPAGGKGLTGPTSSDTAC